METERKRRRAREREREREKEKKKKGISICSLVGSFITIDQISFECYKLYKMENIIIRNQFYFIGNVSLISNYLPKILIDGIYRKGIDQIPAFVNCLNKIQSI